MKPRSSRTLSGRSCSGSKIAPPPFRAARLRGLGHEQLVDHGALAVPGTKEPSHALHVLARAEASAHDDADLRIGNVEALIQHLSRDERPQLARPEGGQHPVA